MNNYFKKAVVITDSHFGRSADSPIANQDNLDFLDWMIERARSWGAETCLFLGDWFHNRASIGVHSLDQALGGLERLSKAGFTNVVCLIGNHDIARRQSRSISSLNFAKHLPNITLISNPLLFGDVLFLPWLVEEDHPLLAQMTSRYTFAHLETIGAMMNARVVCTGGQHAVDAASFRGQEYVFSGHFHQRQTLKNIVYVGSIMPFDFSDANDSARGAMFLEWGKDPFFEAWPDQPLYHTATLSKMLDNLEALRPRMTVRASIDVELRYEEAQELRDVLISNYGLRKLELVNASPVEAVQADSNTELHTVDQIVIDGLQGIESAGLSNTRLIEIFLNLPR